jgi:hypothetical protein
MEMHEAKKERSKQEASHDASLAWDRTGQFCCKTCLFVPQYLVSRVTGNHLKNSTWTITAFYKGESQEKNFPGDWMEQRFLPGSPAYVM